MNQWKGGRYRYQTCLQEPVIERTSAQNKKQWFGRLSRKTESRTNGGRQLTMILLLCSTQLLKLMTNQTHYRPFFNIITQPLSIILKKGASSP